ncbi:MAG: hypothetical protein Pars92KO_27030 [Parasphingorhabdus sp.]
MARDPALPNCADLDEPDPFLSGGACIGSSALLLVIIPGIIVFMGTGQIGSFPVILSNLDISREA